VDHVGLIFSKDKDMNPTTPMNNDLIGVIETEDVGINSDQKD
jgi:hypothetical protein